MAQSPAIRSISIRLLPYLTSLGGNSSGPNSSRRDCQHYCGKFSINVSALKWSYRNVGLSWQVAADIVSIALRPLSTFFEHVRLQLLYGRNCLSPLSTGVHQIISIPSSSRSKNTTVALK